MQNFLPNAAMVELHVDDFAVVKDFYGMLGFETLWETAPDGHHGYLVMRWEDNVMCFWCGNKLVTTHPYFKDFPGDTRQGYGVEVVLMTKDLDAAYEVFKNTDAMVEPLKTKPWGLRDFRIKDPYGFYLRVTTVHHIQFPAHSK